MVVGAAGARVAEPVGADRVEHGRKHRVGGAQVGLGRRHAGIIRAALGFTWI